eukprot:COSAG06_NODE_1171_length_10418_cov_8.441216_3_plen_117_part_00
MLCVYCQLAKIWPFLGRFEADFGSTHHHGIRLKSIGCWLDDWSVGHTCFVAGGEETVFKSHLCVNAIFLPRQARDKHRESTQKTTVILSGGPWVGATVKLDVLLKAPVSTMRLYYY